MTKDTREVFFARAARKVGGKKGTDLFMAQYYRSKNNLSPFRKINDTTPIDAQSINTRL
ncbi:hypothetical protein RTH74_00900 [Pseudomonas sp. zfem001]|uniref:hypothetical protein n=1 Tax=Pseudomonas sp. zfem001 TaxID=3078196 RepID=UPI002927D87C|nr:hypothetical protein [Pseudomonas sp. zfem001]MDU9406141.1 hypothetical protein [Pseudomonas sp. zfem001]